MFNRFNKFLQTILLIIVFATVHTAVLADSSSSSTANTITSNEVENYLMGKFNPVNRPGFVKVPQRYANRKGYYLREEALAAFKKMHAAARKDKVNLIMRSATRNFDYQKRIWNRKWKQKRQSFPNAKSRVKAILQFSSMPGTSRHHWGTEVDLNSFNNGWFTYGKGLKLFNWMNANAHKYGFHRPYTRKNSDRATGYNEEKWHWSYTPLSKAMLNDAKGLITDAKITGFSGSEYATELSIVNHYIFGVHPSCR